MANIDDRPYFCQKLGKMSQNLSSAAVVIGTLRVNASFIYFFAVFYYMSYKNLNWQSTYFHSFNEVYATSITLVFFRFDTKF